MKKQLPAWLVLCIIALTAGLLLSLTNAQTAPKIAEQNRIAANAARAKVLPAAETFAEVPLRESSFPMDNCYAGRAGERVVGYVGQMTVKGYGGEIEVVAGVDMNGVITGVSVGGANFSETAGLGAKTREAAFTDQFTGIAPPAVLKENIDSVTGASVSSGAIVTAVNQISSYIYTEELGLASAPEP